MPCKPSILLLLPFVASLAQAQPALSADALVGTCQLSVQQASGARVSTLVEFRPDGGFGTTTAVDGRPLRSASGTWRIVGRSLEWTYLESAHLTVGPGKVVVDEIQSLDSEQVTLKSRTSADTLVCRRVRYEAARAMLR